MYSTHHLETSAFSNEGYSKENGQGYTFVNCSFTKSKQLKPNICRHKFKTNRKSLKNYLLLVFLFVNNIIAAAVIPLERLAQCGYKARALLKLLQSLVCNSSQKRTEAYSVANEARFVYISFLCWVTQGLPEISATKLKMPTQGNTKQSATNGLSCLGLSWLTWVHLRR